MLNYYLSFLPFISYWATCGILELFYCKDDKTLESTKNTITKKEVFYNTLSVTSSTVLINMLCVYFNIFDNETLRYYYILLGIWMIDTIEYFFHITMHKVKFLYKHMHKHHHSLHIPYHFGALYNSSCESTIESILIFSGIYLLGFSYKEFIIVTSLAHIATVIDHTSLNYKKQFHYLHHTIYNNNNFQQPFFTYYDKLFGTYKIIE